MRKKFLCLFLILSICTFSLTGCYDATSIENLSYAIAIGLDEGDNNIIKLSIQIATPSAISNASEGSSQSDTTTLTSIECASLESGLNLINSYISKQINLSHCKVIVISESLAAKGISDYIYTLVNDIQIRPTCNIIVSRCEAINFLEHAKPTLETLTARYYEAALNSSEYTAYTADVQLNDFYSALKSSHTQPVAILAGVNVNQSYLISSDVDKFNVDSSYKANETPIIDKTNLECMGLAVFYQDKLVGELNSIESLCYSIVSNKLENCMITIPNPDSPNEAIDISLSMEKSTKNAVQLINNTPYIKISASLEGHVTSASKNSNYYSTQVLENLSYSSSQYLKSQISSYLYKTSKDFKSDINGFGKYAVQNYLTLEEWISSEWLNNYQNAFFDVDVSVNVKSGELFSKM